MNSRFVIKIDRENSRILCLNILLAVFLITKMLRGIESSNAIGGIWNYIQLLIIAWGLVLVFSNLSFVRKSTPIKLFLWYTFFSFLFALIHIPQLSVGSLYSFFMILYPGMLICVVYYCYTNKDIKQNKLILATFYVIAILFIRAQLQYYNALASRATISNAYYVLSLLPLILLLTPPKYHLIPMAISFLTLMLSAKRAGFIGLILGIMVYYFIMSISKSRVTSFFKYLLIAVIVLFILYQATNLLDQRFGMNFISRLYRTIEDGGSGRDIRWQSVIDAIRSSSIISITFGHGSSSLTTTIGYAHNDFLQVMYENGLIALVLYISYYIALIILDIKMIKAKYEFSAELGMSIIISLSLALFSFYIVDGTFITCGMLTQGFILANWDRARENNQTLRM